MKPPWPIYNQLMRGCSISWIVSLSLEQYGEAITQFGFINLQVKQLDLFQKSQKVFFSGDVINLLGF